MSAIDAAGAYQRGDDVELGMGGGLQRHDAEPFDEFVELRGSESEQAQRWVDGQVVVKDSHVVEAGEGASGRELAGVRRPREEDVTATLARRTVRIRASPPRHGALRDVHAGKTAGDVAERQLVLDRPAKPPARLRTAVENGGACVLERVAGSPPRHTVDAGDPASSGAAGRDHPRSLRTVGGRLWGRDVDPLECAIEALT